MSKNDTHIITGKNKGFAGNFTLMGSYPKLLDVQAKNPGSVISKLDVPGDPSSARPMSDTDPTAGVDAKILADLAAIDAKNGEAGGSSPSQAVGDDGQFDRVMASVRSAGLRSLDPELGK